MSTAILILQIRAHWWAWLFVICVISYSVYSFIRESLELKAVKDSKKKHESELASLEAKYDEQARILEGKIKERERLYKGGKR